MVELSPKSVVYKSFMVAHDIDSMMVQFNCGGVCTITNVQKPRRKVWVTRSTYVVFERQVVKVVPKT